jgi:hypothetical protein
MKLRIAYKIFRGERDRAYPGFDSGHRKRPLRQRLGHWRVATIHAACQRLRATGCVIDPL